MSEVLKIVRYFVTSRWLRRFRSRNDFEKWQAGKVREFLGRVVKDCPYYRGLPTELEAMPVMNKRLYREHFHDLNREEIRLERAEEVALKAETERDFSPEVVSGVSVGLSSGTSGSRSVFLVSAGDRVRWAGILLSKVLSGESLRHLMTPWKRPLKVAFFLRANSNLYRTVASRRIDFRYFDLLRGVEILAEELEAYRPDLLIGPATVLVELAGMEGVSVRPRQVISVAEVLDDHDAEKLRERFGVVPQNLYQATEGFIAATCPAGNLHLNEEWLHVGREWLDQEKTRFHPIITDFTRETQYFVRYRLDDVLVIDDRPCPCGRVTQRLKRIEGRADEVLWFGSAIFPDAIRQAMYSMPMSPGAYRVEQHGDELHVLLKDESPELAEAVREAMSRLFERSNLPVPRICFRAWFDQPAGEKLRRIRCVIPFQNES